MFNNLYLKLTLIPLLSIGKLSCEETLLDTQVVIIELIESYEIALGTNISIIKARVDKSLHPPAYYGDCFNTLTISANTPVLLQVTIGNHNLTLDDQLDLQMSPPSNGLSRKVTLWNGISGALNEQLAYGIEGDDNTFRLKFSYKGGLKTEQEQKQARIFFTIFAADGD